jgi:TubC N-terminal docking domain
MTAVIATLAAADIRLRAVAGRLVVDAPQGALTPDMRALLAEHRDALLEHAQRRERLAFDAWASPLYAAVWAAARERRGSAAPAPHLALEHAIDTADRKAFERELREYQAAVLARPAKGEVMLEALA